jgi:hypothetical protein
MRAPALVVGVRSSLASTWHTTGGSPCASTSRHPEHIEKIEIDMKPKHGIAGKNGSFGVAYKPNPGFKGSDSFSYAVTPKYSFRGPAHVTVFIILE